jgi:hypothetical protein
LNSNNERPASCDDNLVVTREDLEFALAEALTMGSDSTTLRRIRHSNGGEEERFLRAWRSHNVGARCWLDYILHPPVDPISYPKSASKEERAVADTLMQWLGTNVGRSFLDEMGYKQADVPTVTWLRFPTCRVFHRYNSSQHSFCGRHSSKGFRPEAAQIVRVPKHTAPDQACRGCKGAA